VMLGAETGLTLVKPLAEAADLTGLVMVQVKPPRYATQIFILGFFAALFGLAWLAPRAWCRWLCPAGALLGLFSGRPLIRRRVSSDCNQCGLCARHCPVGAIPDQEPNLTLFRVSALLHLPVGLSGKCGQLRL